MFAPALEASYHGLGAKGGPIVRRFLNHLNTGTLACAMFVALALLSQQGKDTRPGKLSAPRATKAEVAVDNASFLPHTVTTAKDCGNKIKLNQ
jgi:hypothetical protein